MISNVRNSAKNSQISLQFPVHDPPQAQYQDGLCRLHQ